MSDIFEQVSDGICWRMLGIGIFLLLLVGCRFFFYILFILLAFVRVFFLFFVDPHND